MSASGHDAIPEFPGKVLRIDAPAPVAPDFTEDLSDEITSELGPAARRAPAVAAPVDDRNDEGGGKPVQSALATSGSVLRERYILETQLGDGGTATVFRAVDLRRDAASADGHRVAIKLLRPELRDRPQNIARLQREFRQTQSVAHANVVRFYDIDCDHGSWFIVMELLTGETLGPCLRRAVPQGLREAEALRIAVAVGEALAHAHAHGVTHGDVKPDNVYLTTSGEVRMLDFGVAPESMAGAAPGDVAATQVTAAATRVYASPEVLAGDDPEPRDDVFSLACVIYEMLAGSHPYGRRGADNALRAGVIPAPITSLDFARQEVLAAALELSRAARPSMEELIRAMRGETLTKATPGPEASAAPPVVTQPLVTPQVAASAIVAVQRPASQHSRLTWLSATAAALALVLGILIGRFNSEPTPVVAQSASLPVVHAPATSAAPESRTPVTLPPRAATKAQTQSEVAPVRAGFPPGLVSFDTPTMIVSNRAVVAAIPLRHLNRAKLGVDVMWRVIDGSARAGRDYGGPLTGVETFVEGNTFRILYVPIVTNVRATGDRTFTVELTGSSAGATVGSMRRIEVTILGDA
jgi:serine/threonine protein kinase